MTKEEELEKERIKREKIRKFESPIPFVILLRNLIFGKAKPDIYTRIVFYISSAIGLMFLLWNCISYFSLVSREWIFNNKGIDIESIIERRGIELGFEGADFINRLQTVSAIAIICWCFFFAGMVLLYRKKRTFIYFTIIPVVFYVFMNTVYLTFGYFLSDTTTFDKIGILILALCLPIHSYLMKNEREGGSISFFGDHQEETDAPDSIE